LNLFGWELSLSRKDGISIDTLLRRIEAMYETISGEGVTPDSAMASPTVQAIVTAVTRRFASLPLEVFEKKVINGRDSKERLPNHPVARLMNGPNEWQDRVSYWMDASSSLLRFGRFCAYKRRGQTGPIRALIPIHPSKVEIIQEDNWDVHYRVHTTTGTLDLDVNELHYVRGPARDYLKGDSPIFDIREAVGLEIAAEKYGASFFGGGAMPGIIFKLVEGFQGFKSGDDRQAFIEDFKKAYTGRGRFKAMLLPRGIDIGEAIKIENDKAQFLETRKYQRTVIAGCFGVPPHLVGDLERGTYNNVEQQTLDFTTNVILPLVRQFEAAMEADLLTQDDRNSGVIIRFNLDATLRGDFKTRQEGQEIQRRNGVINANDWRSNENMNPIEEEDGGEGYWLIGPQGQASVPGIEPVKPGTETPPKPTSPNGAGGKHHAYS
jgi:HK97 family phage portal protein